MFDRNQQQIRIMTPVILVTDLDSLCYYGDLDIWIFRWSQNISFFKVNKHKSSAGCLVPFLHEPDRKEA
jgi:hypothetical protein